MNRLIISQRGNPNLTVMDFVRNREFTHKCQYYKLFISGERLFIYLSVLLFWDQYF